MTDLTKTVFLTFVFSFLLSGCQENKEQPLTIATAANMQFAMKELSRLFTEKTGKACEPIFSSSGKLTAQIKEGAPFDVFVSADMKFPNDLHQSGLTMVPPKIYAYGQLVLWAQATEVVPSLALLQSKEVKHIALANPKTAPYGMAAKEVLQHYAIFEEVKEKLVYGESIAQTNQFITSKAAALGFTAMSVVLSPQMAGQGKWIALDSTSYSPIAQGVVLIKSQRKQQEEAKQFYDFLFSSAAQEVLKKYGYRIS